MVSRIAVPRVRRQQRRQQQRRSAAAVGRRHPRSDVVQRMDRRAACDAARGSRRRPEGQWLLAEGADAAAMSRSVPMAKAMDDAMIALYQNGERIPSGAGLSDAAVPARLRRQHERQVAAPAQGDGRADDDEGRDVEVHRLAAGRPRAAVHVPDGSEVRDHVAVGGHRRCRARASTRSRASRGRARAASRASKCRPTAAADLGARPRSTSAVLPKARHALPHAVALGRRPERAAEPRDRRDGRGAADAPGADGRRAARRSAITTTRFRRWSVAAAGEVSNVYA